MADHPRALVAITPVAAFVNGALGYGFSSITAPPALLFVTNRVLNPALVPIEVVINAYVLWTNRAAVPRVWRRVIGVAIGLVPGIARSRDGAAERLARLARSASSDDEAADIVRRALEEMLV